MYIRKANKSDLSRIAEIYVFNNRICYYPVFNNDSFSFGDLQVISIANDYFAKSVTEDKIYIYDDSIVKGFVEIGDCGEIFKLYVEPLFQSSGIGGKLLEYVIQNCSATFLWVLEKNNKAIDFYLKHGFEVTTEKQVLYGVNGHVEYKVKLRRK